LHNKLCTYYDGRKVFELGGCEESCLESTILKIISRMEKRGQVLVCVVVRRPACCRYNSS
jgi:hypothetical protein